MSVCDQEMPSQPIGIGTTSSDNTRVCIQVQLKLNGCTLCSRTGIHVSGQIQVSTGRRQSLAALVTTLGVMQQLLWAFKDMQQLLCAFADICKM
jgi:hypothetical protein